MPIIQSLTWSHPIFLLVSVFNLFIRTRNYPIIISELSNNLPTPSAILVSTQTEVVNISVSSDVPSDLSVDVTNESDGLIGEESLSNSDVPVDEEVAK